jgi:predicted Zn-dependent protease
MVNIDQSEVKTDRFFSKKFLILVIVLILIPTIFTINSIYFREKIKVGIVLTTEGAYAEGEIAQNSLNKFHDVFTAKILNVKFNESGVRVQNGSYLTDDYFNSTFSRSIRDNFKIDIIMIITNKTINNWLGNRLARWGQADTSCGIVLITTAPFSENATLHEKYIVSTTRHEILHLLGYGHPDDSRKCLMQYASLETELCQECEILLPYYVALWKIGYGHEPERATFLIRASIFLVLSTLFVLAVVISQFLFRKYIYRRNRINQVPFILGVGGLYITILLTAAFVEPFYPQIIILLAVVFMYIIIESLSYEFRFKIKEQA